MADAPEFVAYLIFDFGEDRAAARQALAQVERWSRAFKLRGQLLAREKAEAGNVHVLVRLRFEEFEKLAFERWLERIPREEVFARARQQAIGAADERFDWASRWFGRE